MSHDIHQDILKTLADLVAINSVNPNFPGGVPELELAQYVERFFSARQIKTFRQQIAPDRPNVIAVIPGRDPERHVVLEAHMDTVSAEGMTIEPWTAEIRDGKLFGRGACDTKGGLAAMMHAAASLVEDGITPPCEVLVAATVDEECSYRGVAAFCDSRDPGPVDAEVIQNDCPPRNPLQADAAIVAEPTRLQPVIASKGLVRWKIETRGRAAHASKPHLGSNAIEAMARVIVALQEDHASLSRQVHPLLGSPTCNVGVINGGVQVNLVPDRCVIEIDRRMLPGETCDAVLNHYQRLLDRIAGEHPDVDVHMHRPMLVDRPLETDPDSKAVAVVKHILSDLEYDPTPIGVPFCSDASKFGALGIASIILGPGSIDQAHAAVEFVECDQVISAMEIYRRFLIEFQGR
jgi:acetylornithine deacetylase